MSNPLLWGFARTQSVFRLVILDALAGLAGAGYFGRDVGQQFDPPFDSFLARDWALYNTVSRLIFSFFDESNKQKRNKKKIE
jgi:hypothetical protein